MVRTKTSGTKKTKVRENNKERDDIVDNMLTKGKKILETEDSDIFTAPIVEEKNEEVVLAEEDQEELALDDAGMDEEEINPFGDKWEE